MLAEPQHEKKGNKRYEGYCIDLIDEISKILEFNYTIKIVEDMRHGRKNERGEWNGLIRDLIDGVSITR